MIVMIWVKIYNGKVSNRGMLKYDTSSEREMIRYAKDYKRFMDEGLIVEIFFMPQNTAYREYPWWTTTALPNQPSINEPTIRIGGTYQASANNELVPSRNLTIDSLAQHTEAYKAFPQ